MELRTSKLKGCLEIIPTILRDGRGHFIKTFHRDVFRQYNLVTRFAEEYYSVSGKNVLRGLHFQTPPMQCIKLVYCTSGCVRDAVVDLRQKSPTFGQYDTFELSAAKANMLYIPAGMAHGFLTLSEQATMMYKVTQIYSPEHDTGILWNSANVPWEIADPIVSERDQRFCKLADFLTPFSGEDYYGK